MSKNSKGLFLGVAAVAIAIVAWFAFFSGSPAPTSTGDGGNVAGQRAGLQEFADGITLGNAGNGAGASEEWYSGIIDPGTNSKLILHNTSGKDLLVDYGEINVKSGDTASSTSLVSIIATTSASIGTWADFGTLTSAGNAKQALIQAAQIATSSTATTTNSVKAAAYNQGNGAILVPNDSYLFAVLQQDITNANIACAAAGQCETATSSNRGFNPVWRVRVHY